MTTLLRSDGAASSAAEIGSDHVGPATRDSHIRLSA
jgi:hypothetical protein